MTREERLAFCSKCANRGFDPSQGVICSLTGSIADFEESCENFNEDATVQEHYSPEELEQVVTDHAPAEMMEEIRAHQDMMSAIAGGALASVVTAVLWAIVTVATGFQIGYMAIAVGLIVGFSVRYFGAGIDEKFGIAGGALAFFGCFLGNIFSIVGFIANQQSLGYFEVLGLMDFSALLSLYAEYFDVMDVLFYGLAVYEGYRFAIRPITQALLLQYKEGNFDATPPLSRFRIPLAFTSLLLVCIATYLLIKGPSGTQTYYYESGAKSAEGELADGKEDGPWTMWYENGQKFATGNFDNGLADGEWQWFNENGILTRKGHYQNGLYHGLWVSYFEDGIVSDSGEYYRGRLQDDWVYYYPSGKVMQQGRYIYDKENGTWEFYNENGSLSSRGVYLSGKPFGKWEYWDLEGRKVQEANYTEDKVSILNAWSFDGSQLVINGNGSFKTFYPDHALEEAGEIKNGARTGHWKWYYDNGQLREEGEYGENGEHLVLNTWSRKGEPEVVNGSGSYQSYYPISNSRMEAGKVENGQRAGRWNVYYESQGLLKDLEYKNGIVNGSSTTYFPSGTKQSEGNYLDDKQDGEWKWYYESGALQCTVSFEAGEKQGTQFFYSETGPMVKEEQYENGQLVSEKLL